VFPQRPAKVVKGAKKGQQKKPKKEGIDADAEID